MMLNVTNNQPDILEVIADLSNDEVFTPPRLANQVLDLLPSKLWSDPNLRFLDPGSKTGVFLREITRRLMEGLSSTFPNEQERLRHILEQMVWGLSITELTAHMTRRTLYCSKDASSSHSVVQFSQASGNVWFQRVEHSFSNGRCKECNASSDLERPGRDNYAYGFIHSDGREKYGKDLPVKFNVIVGNPPYQMDGGAGGTSASPLYNVFVEQAKAMNPDYLAMIIPSRWMAGGRGLDEFRKSMLSDQKVTHLVDFPNTKDVFPGVDIKGGVCYFLWEADHKGDALMTIVRGEEKFGPVNRNLGEFDVLVRDGRAVDILRRVRKLSEPTIEGMVSGNTPFGLATNFRGYTTQKKGKPDELKLYLFGDGKRSIGYIKSVDVSKNTHMVDVWKIFLPAAYGAGETVPHQILGQSIIGEPKSVCTQTYLTFGPFESESEAQNAQSYLNTRFARFLVSLRKISQDAQASVYSWVPQQDWSTAWTDELLLKKYNIDEKDWEYIQSMVKEMN
jgi:site-specific DNA-methyltransferase (adenine-specific)